MRTPVGVGAQGVFAALDPVPTVRGAVGTTPLRLRNVSAFPAALPRHDTGRLSPPGAYASPWLLPPTITSTSRIPMPARVSMG